MCGCKQTPRVIKESNTAMFRRNIVASNSPAPVPTGVQLPVSTNTLDADRLRVLRLQREAIRRSLGR